MNTDPPTMAAAVATAPGRIEHRRVPVPVPGPGELRARVLRSGICGSDLAVLRGTHPTKTLPAVLGHEFCGVVESVGPGCPVAPGTAVAALAYAPCGACARCRDGRTNLCPHRRSIGDRDWPGTFAEQVVLDHRMVVALPPDLSPDLGALVEPLSIAAHALATAGPGDARSLVVLGCGGIGLAVLALARAHGFATATGIDVGPAKEALVRAAGADRYLDHADHVDHTDAGARPRDLDRAADVVVVCTGHPGSLDDAAGLVRSGGDVVVVTYFDGPVEIRANDLVAREVTVRCSALSTLRDAARVVELMSSGRIDPRPCITHRFGLDEAGAATALLARGGAGTGKVMLVPDPASGPAPRSR